MCLICVHYGQGKLTLKEAWRNLGEMRSGMDPDHVAEVEELLTPEELWGLDLHLDGEVLLRGRKGSEHFFQIKEDRWVLSGVEEGEVDGKRVVGGISLSRVGEEPVSFDILFPPVEYKGDRGSLLEQVQSHVVPFVAVINYPGSHLTRVYTDFESLVRNLLQQRLEGQEVFSEDVPRDRRIGFSSKTSRGTQSWEIGLHNRDTIPRVFFPYLRGPGIRQDFAKLLGSYRSYEALVESIQCPIQVDTQYLEDGNIPFRTEVIPSGASPVYDYTKGILLGGCGETLLSFETLSRVRVSMFPANQINLKEMVEGGVKSFRDVYKTDPRMVLVVEQYKEEVLYRGLLVV